ncbi:MAG: FAD/NAD(P)-binding protein [Candidatus Latescibacteria bacterium]|nr:FAD/NAD(P)-binding protein [Candidatus Latescibacterota bacterium]
MKNPFQPFPVTITKIIDETPTIKTFVLDLQGNKFSFDAGQFIQLTIPGVGEAPFTPSSSPFVKDTLEMTIMKVGRATSALFEMKPGDSLAVRGPFGKRYPIEEFEKREVLILGGGVGLAPLRSLFLALAENIKKYGKIYIKYGARTPADIVYKYLLPEWKTWKGVDIDLSVDVGDKTWKGKTGVVTVLLDDSLQNTQDIVAVVCGPPIMMKFGTLKLLEKGFDGKNIYLSMEKNMSCGIGQCGHCRCGKYFVCQDGPVLTWDQVKDIEDPF